MLVALVILLVPVVVEAEQRVDCVPDDPTVIHEVPREEPSISLTGTPGSLDFARSLNDVGNTALERGDLGSAAIYHRRALAIRQKLAPRSLVLAETLNALGNLALERGELDAAKGYMDRSLRIRAAVAPGSRDVALSLMSLGTVARRRGDIVREEAYFQRALAIGDALTPIDLADILDGLGVACAQRNCTQGARDYFHRSLAIRRQLQPDSLGLANTLGFLGRAASNQGDLDEAERDFAESFELRRRLAPGSIVLAASLTDLGVLARTRGNLAQAERCLRQGLQIRERLAPHGSGVADSLHNLGIVLWLRDDLDGAQDYFDKTLRLRRKLVPGSPMLAQSLIWQGLLYVRRGKVTQAQANFLQALELLEKDLSSDSLAVASVLSNLGNLARIRDELALSQEYYRRALAIQSQQAPDSPAEANTLQVLGGLSRQHGDFSEAESYYRRALAIQERKVPDSSAHAGGLFAFASLLRQEKKREDAARTYAEAVDVLERQTDSLGGTPEDRSVFRARFENSYRDYVDLLVGMGHADLALHVLERARARALLEMLSVARVSVRGGRDSALDRLKRSLEEEIGARSSYRIRLLDGSHTGSQLSELDKELSDLQARYRETEDQLALQDPAYAALTRPRILTSREVQELLDENTLLLEYSLGPGVGHVWAVTHTTLTVYRLPGRETIERAARRVRGLLTARSRMPMETEAQRTRRLALADAQFPSAARELSRLVLGPVAQLSGSRRIVIVADGALQYVPFVALPALPVQTGGGGGDDPLVMQHEIVSLPSASVLAELRRESLERVPPAKAVAVLADPVFDIRDERIKQEGLGEVASELERSAGAPLERHLSASLRGPVTSTDRATDDHLDRLPWTRLEAAQILKGVPQGASLRALDFAASRATALSPLLAQYRIVHFATHAVSDGEHLERSGLVLSLFDEHGRPQNGFVGLQEIYGLNLPADLVVLSACDTSLGREVDGEGLMGLVRGFMYAGATRVMASLWSVDDEGTAQLMADFYKSLEEGSLGPAASLRAAQMEIRKQPRWRSPYYWAGFQIEGEWR
jgi:CHAT domain-containing protein/tetratricopeptide (TPR) repeat protein